MKYKIRHSTSISYSAPVAQAQFNLRLLPWPWPGQTMRNYSLSCTPEPDEQTDLSGPYCVNTTRISFSRPLSELELRSEFGMEVAAVALPDDGPQLQQLIAEALTVRDLSALAPAPYMFASRIAETDGAIARWGRDHLQGGEGAVAVVSRLMSAINSEFAYQPGATTSSTPPAEAFSRREGVCQDFAHIMIMALRSQGIPAAYASGYLRTEPPPGQPRLVGADAMHAWVNVWCGSQLGWVGFDPTNDCLARDDHIQIAMGRDYADVAPIDGTFFGSAPQSMTTSVDVAPIETADVG